MLISMLFCDVTRSGCNGRGLASRRTGLWSAVLITVLLSGPMTCRLLAQPAHNVRDFGAKGDGISDDTHALEAAIASGDVDIPRGTYLLTRELTVSHPVRIAGEGSNSVLEWKSADTGLAISNTNAVYVSNVRLIGKVGRLVSIAHSSNIHIDHAWLSGGGSGGTTNPKAALSISASNNVWITGSDFTNDTGYDIVTNFMSAPPSAGLHIESNNIHGSHAHISIALFDTSHSSVERNSIDQNDQTAGTNNDGYGILIYCKQFAKQPPQDNVISDNTVRNTAGSAIYVQGSLDTVISRNHIFNSVQHQNDRSLPAAAIAVNAGYAAARYALNVSITDNEIDTSGKCGVELSSTKNANVKGNSIRHAATQAIRLRGKEQGAVVQGNTLY